MKRKVVVKDTVTETETETVIDTVTETVIVTVTEKKKETVTETHLGSIESDRDRERDSETDSDRDTCWFTALVKNMYFLAGFGPTRFLGLLPNTTIFFALLL